MDDVDPTVDAVADVDDGDDADALFSFVLMPVESDAPTDDIMPLMISLGIVPTSGTINS